MINNGWIGNYSYFRARVSPDKEGLYDLDLKKGLTFSEIDRRADVLGNYLLEKFGLVKGDRIASISRNRIEMFDLYYATGKTGTIFVPYNARLSSDELIQLINSETPRVLFYEDVFEETVKEIRKGVNIEYFVRLENQEADSTDVLYTDVIEYDNDNPLKCETLDLEDTHMIIHTGGTTGLPKGAMISHRAMLYNAMNEIVTWGISHHDSTHLLLPLFHTGGWNLLTLPLLHAGGRVMINRGFDPKMALEVIEQEKPTFIFGAATIFRMMTDQPSFEATDFSSVKWVMAGAAPTPINIMEKFWSREIPFVLGYGMTEAGPNNLTGPAENMNIAQMRDKFASVGKPMYFTLVKIVDDEGNEVSAGTPGELVWSGPQIFSGYWNNEKETQETLRDGWVYTGDMAIVDEDGFYYIVGRKKNMYISGGENVFPPEVEKAIYGFEGIHEVCVIGVPDELWGEVGKAVLTLKPNEKVDQDELKNYLVEKLAKFKVPKFYEIIEELPKNNVGKIMRNKIQEIYGENK